MARIIRNKEAKEITHITIKSIFSNTFVSFFVDKILLDFNNDFHYHKGGWKCQVFLCFKEKILHQFYKNLDLWLVAGIFLVLFVIFK